MAESKGCAKALRRVTRGEPDSTNSPGRELSNMRDWVATLGVYSTRGRGFNTEDTESAEKKARKKEFRMRGQKEKVGQRGCLPHEARVVLLFGGGGFGGGIGVFLGEALDAAGGVNEFLFAGEEWVAIRADFHAKHIALDGGARLESMAASAVHS